LFVEEFMSYMYLCHFGLLRRVMSYDYMSNMAGLIRSRNCLPFASINLGSPFFFLSLSCVLCAQCCLCLWIVHSWLPPSVFSNIYSSCVLCTQLGQCCLYMYILWWEILLMTQPLIGHSCKLYIRLANWFLRRIFCLFLSKSSMISISSK
jgi:hypothetical protein